MKKEWVAKELTMEVVVGAFMVMVLLGLCYFTIVLSRENIFTGAGLQREIIFNEIMGLSKGDRVMVHGMTVGKVKRFVLADDGVHVFILLEEPLEIKKDYNVTVITASILGGRYLQIDPGTHTAERLPDGVKLRGTDPNDLVEDTAAVVNSIKKALDEGGIVDNFKQIMANLKNISERVNAGKGTIGRLLSDDDKMYRDLSDTVASVKNLAERIEKGEGTIGKLMSADDKMYRDLKEAVESFKNIVTGIEKGEGMIGKLMKDEKLYKEVESLVNEARATIDDFRETAPITTFTSIFFGAF